MIGTSHNISLVTYINNCTADMSSLSGRPVFVVKTHFSPII